LTRFFPLTILDAKDAGRTQLTTSELTVLDSEIKLASLIGSMNEAFKLFRSASVTPRATERAPQTKIGTFPLTTLSISSGRGGKPTP
jgi:hypothetical protein